jgi:hypothetical protein
MANETVVPGRRLGRLPTKSTRKALQFAEFFKFLDIPKVQNCWGRRKPLGLRSYGNNEFGCCTRAKQAVAITRMERLEARRSPNISDEEVVRVYREMCVRKYGSDADNGAYEDDALNEWRNPETTIKDVSGHPFTIDAYLRVNAADEREVRAALAFAGAKGVAVCFNLPLAWADLKPPRAWDVAEDQPLVGRWMPGSWGGHSMWMPCDYDASGPTGVDHTWLLERQPVSWRAMATYCDEVHVVIDSVNAWRRQSTSPKVRRALADVRDAVNAVSSLPIA